MDIRLQDLRYAVRQLRASPGFTLAAVLTLALGIGANTAVFSVVEGVLLRSLPFPGADRLVDIKSNRGTAALSAYETWRTATGVFEDMAAASPEQPVLVGPEGAERVTTWVVTANFFPLLGGRAALGRLFLAEEDRPGSDPVAVLSYAFWQSRFGGDPHVLGRTLTLDTVSYTIVGVMSPDFRTPAGFRHPDDTQLWLGLGSFLSGPSGAQPARQIGVWIVGRLRPGVTLAGATAALDVVSRHSWEKEPRDRGLVPVVTPLRDWLVRHVRTPLLVMLGAVGLVLLVACANAASLLLSRGVARAHELAVRVALGASRPRLFLQAITEAVLLALAGGALGVLVALWTVPVLVRLAGSELPHLAGISVNARVLVAALGVSAFAGLLAGFAPALRATQHGPADALKPRSAGGGGAPRHRSSDALIVAQVALTMILLSGAGLLGRSFLHLVRLDPGFDPEGVVTAQFRLPETRYRTGEARVAFVEQALARIRALPGVTAAAGSTGMPLEGGSVGTVGLPGQPEDPARPMAWFVDVTDEYFQTLGIPLKRGSAVGDARQTRGVIIDEAAARAYFPDADPIGRTLTLYGGSVTRTVTGVVGDARQESLHEAPPPHIYEPFGSHPHSYLKILVRTAADPASLVGPLRRAIHEVDATVPIDRVAPMYELLGEARARHRFYSLLLALFAAAALALAATGMYGIAAYAVTRRTQEIGIRMALGAGRRAVLGLIVSRGLALTLAGIALGVAGALVGTRLLRPFLFETGPRDPVALTVVALLLFTTALVASYLPARRATRVDPIVALRYE